MTRSALCALALFAAAATTTPALAQGHRGKITHWDSPEEGFPKARNNRKPILLFFTASW
jgi:hypothetical protein